MASRLRPTVHGGAVEEQVPNVGRDAEPCALEVVNATPGRLPGAFFVKTIAVFRLCFSFSRSTEAAVPLLKWEWFRQLPVNRYRI
jgi:hypothetical protein